MWSAKWWTFQCFIAKWRSFTYSRKSKGLKTDILKVDHRSHLKYLMQNYWFIQIASSQLNMIQTICLIIHIFHNDIIYSTECYDPQYQKVSEGQQKYHMQSYHHQELSLLLPTDLLEHMKVNSAAKTQTEGCICCFCQEICRSYYKLFFQWFYHCWIIKRLVYNLSITTLILFCALV